jgi:hypothetical protein
VKRKSEQTEKTLMKLLAKIHEAFMVDKNVRLTETIETEVIPDDYRKVSTNSIA